METYFDNMPTRHEYCCYENGWTVNTASNIYIWFLSAFSLINKKLVPVVQPQLIAQLMNITKFSCSNDMYTHFSATMFKSLNPLDVIM